MAGIIREAWSANITRGLLRDCPWVDDLMDYTQYANEGVLHIPYQDEEPLVYIDNTTYPLSATVNADGSVDIPFHKLETQPSIVRDPEAAQLSYDLMESENDKHRRVLRRDIFKLAAFNLAPTLDTVNTPVLETTGADDGSGRKRLRIEDIGTLWDRWVDAELPDGRLILILNTDHVSDIRSQDIELYNQLWDHQRSPGTAPINIEGFECYVASKKVWYNKTTRVKEAFGAVQTADSWPATIAFHTGCAGKGHLVPQLKEREAPEESGRLFNYWCRFNAFPIREGGLGTASIVSATV